VSPELLAAVRQALVLAAWLMSPVLVAALISGALAGALAGVTTWREATLSHAIRLLLVALAWTLTAPWIAAELQAFALIAWGGG
jgi:type III secretory pathway component EscS